MPAQPVNVAILHDSLNLAEIASMFSKVKPMMNFTYSSYCRCSFNSQNQAPKFEFDEIPRTFVSFEMLDKREEEFSVL